MSKHLANQIRTAAQRLRDAETAHQKVAEKLAAALAAFPEAPSLADLELAVQDAAAAHALGEATAADVEAARKALAQGKTAASALSAERAALQMAVDGLTRREAAAQAELAAAREGLQAAIGEWLRGEASAAEAQYLEAAEAVVRARVRHLALVRALRERGEKLTDLENLADDLVLPTIGTATGSRFLEAEPNEPHAVGKNLVRPLSRGLDAPVESELADLLDPKQAGGIVAAFTRRLRAA